MKKIMEKNKQLLISAVLFTVIIILWPFFMALSRLPGSITEQLTLIALKPGIFKLQFFSAFLIAPSIIYLMLAQREHLSARESLAGKMGLLFLPAYLILVSISYGSQMLLVPGFLKTNDESLVLQWYFGNTDSIPYFLNQMGYFFWALAAITLFGGFIRESGWARLLGILYLFSALLSIIAFLGLILENQSLNSLTFVSGMLMLPIGILSIFRAVKTKKTPDTLL